MATSQPAADTVTVSVTVQGIERLRDTGRLLALAVVEVEIDGIAIGLNGVRIVRMPASGIGIEAPTFRHRGLSRAAVDLPVELRDAIADQVIDAYRRGGGVAA